MAAERADDESKTNMDSSNPVRVFPRAGGTLSVPKRVRFSTAGRKYLVYMREVDHCTEAFPNSRAEP